MTFDQFKRAIIAKTKNKVNMPDWYYKRLEMCSSCDKNSGNQEKISFKDRIRISHNFGKDSCLICSCSVFDKSSDPIEECPIGKWKAQETAERSKKIDIEVLSKEMVTLYYEKDIPILDYGIIKYKSNSAINIQILTDKYLSTSISSSCGCTVPKLKENDKGYLLNITYDTKRLGAFTKNINITFINKGVQDKLTLKITGTVANNI